MKNSNFIVTIIILLLFVGLGVYVFYPRENWNYTLANRGTDPYDLALYHALVEDRIEGDILSQTGSFEDWDWSEAKNGQGVMALGYNNYFDSIYQYKMDSLLEAGNVLLFLNEPLNEYTVKFLKGEFIVQADSLEATIESVSSSKKKTKEGEKDTVTAQLLDVDSLLYAVSKSYLTEVTALSLPVVNVSTGSKSTFNYAYKNDTLHLDDAPAHLFFVHQPTLDSLFDNYEVIAHVDGAPQQIVAFRIPKGKGWIEFHVNKSHITNYCLANAANFDYVNDYVKEWPSDFYWETSYFNLTENQNPYNTADGGEDSPLDFLLSLRSTRWAWYTLLFAIALFLVSKTQRIERVIPILQTPVNQTLEFAKSMGILQSKASNAHAVLALEIKRQFVIWSRERFHKPVEINGEYRDKLKLALPEASGQIETLFYLFNKAEKMPSEFTASDINNVYSVTRYLYQNV